MSGTIDNEGNVQIGGKDSYRMSFSSLLTYASKGKDFLLIGDNDHSKLNIIMTAISKESIATMKALGVKHLCLEMPMQAQDDVDAYYAGKVTYEQIEKVYITSKGRPWFTDVENRVYMTRLAQMLREAKAAGIRVHYVDDNTPLPIMTEQPLMTLIRDKAITLSDSDRDAYLQSLEKEKPGVVQAYKDYMDTKLKQRYERDQQMAEGIRQMAKDGKVAVVYGGAHYEKSEDLNEYLGVDRSVVIAIETSWHPKDLSNEPSRGDDLPHFVYFTDFPEDSGKLTQRGAKIQSNEQRSEACKVAVKTGRPTYLAGCTVADVDLENFTAIKTPNLKSQQPKAKAH